MRAALTQMAIDNLPVSASKVERRDTRLKGLVLRAMPSGSKSWYCEYARGKRIFLGRADVLGLAEARESARTILADHFRGVDPIEARKPKATMPTYGAYLDGDYAVWSRSTQKAHAQNWPAAVLMDIEKRCFIEPEEQDATKEAQPRVQA